MQKTVNKIIAHAVEIVQPEKIILFGSVASGKNDVYSDIDLLIVTDNSSLKGFFIHQIKNFAREFSLSADVLIYSESELEKASLNATSFLSAVVKHGKIVYKKPL